MTAVFYTSAALIAASLCALPPPASAAPTETILHNFTGYPNDGNNVLASLVFGPGGSLYGLSQYGSGSNGGTLFQLTPPANGQTTWTESILYSFDGSIGAFPDDTPIVDAAGNLYATAQVGGQFSMGSAFELSPPTGSNTAWTGTAIYSFSGPDGATPFGRLIADSAGNLYGTTTYGGTNWTSGQFTGDGLVFKLTPPTSPQTAWTETILHYFSGPDGSFPKGGLAIDRAGNLYGTSGGGTGSGTVFELSPPAANQTAWTFTTLHEFNTADGYGPNSSVTNFNGKLYGTTVGGGQRGYGVVFQLTPPGRGKTAWKYETIHFFTNAHGANPQGDLVFDTAGNLYLTSPSGGRFSNGGVFEFTPPASGHGMWTETVLLPFATKTTAAGAVPAAGVTLDASGNLYGVTAKGGSSNDGVAFELTP
jgi:uncharacterized repeat protein (TIGR03803 family)